MICCMLIMNMPLLYIYGINDVWILKFVDVQNMEIMEQLEPYMCISPSRLSYFLRGLVEINPIDNFKCLFEIDVVQLLWYVYDNCNSQRT